MGYNNRIQYVNTLRGLAALSVVLSHYFDVFWRRRDAVNALIASKSPVTNDVPPYIEWLKFHPYVDYGAFGVALFFLISGFVITASLSKTAAVPFLCGRFWRIVPTYAAGFTVCLLAIRFNVWAYGGEWPYSLADVLVHYFPGMRVVAGTANIDGIIWTLEIEVFFYLLCAMGAPLFRNLSPKILIIPAVLAAAILIAPYLVETSYSTFAGRLMFCGLFVIYMFAGSTLFLAQKGIISRAVAFAIVVAILVIFSGLWWYEPLIPFTQIWNYLSALVIFTVAFSLPRLFRGNKVTDFFADISYPLYAVHGVAGYTLLVWLLGNGISTPASLAITTLAAILAAYIIHRLVEIPSHGMSKRVSRPKLVSMDHEGLASRV